MAYGDDGQILNSLNFRLLGAIYTWGPFPNGIAAFSDDKFPVNQGVDTNPIWYFGTNIGGTNQWTASSVVATSSIANYSNGDQDAGIENSGALVSLTNIEIYVKAQLFIVNTVTNTAGATLTIPITGLNTPEGATIIVPYIIWQFLEATGQQHKIVMKVYIAHFKYKKGCWSGGDYTARVNETTYTTVDLVPITPNGAPTWEQGWVDNVNSPVIANWRNTQQLSRVSNSIYESSTISINANLEAILPGHPVNGFIANYIDTPQFNTPYTLKVNVAWGNIAISAGVTHSLGLKADGTVVAVGSNTTGSGECNVGSWTNIIAIAAGGAHSLGLKADGTVVATGGNYYGQCDVGGWTNIIAISAGYGHSLGLKADGTVVAVGDNSNDQCNVSGWTDITAISAGSAHSLGLKANTTVIAAGIDEVSELEVDWWSNIKAIEAGDRSSLGLRVNGTVIATGDNYYGQLDVGTWFSIKAISTGFGSFTLGLRTSGTVMATGNNYYGQLNVGGWSNIIAISAGEYYSLGLKADGTVEAVGRNDYGQCNVSGWYLGI